MAANQNGELANEFPLPASNTSHKALLTVGRASLDKATAQKVVLLGLGMAPKVLDELAAALSEYEQTLEASRAGRQEHVEASADLKAVATEITEQVELLNSFVRYQFGDDPEVMSGGRRPGMWWGRSSPRRRRRRDGRRLTPVPLLFWGVLTP